MAIPQVGRNQGCPCGSGKKYKRCHGDLASAKYSPPPRPSMFNVKPLDPTLDALGGKVLDLLSDVGASIKYDRANVDDWFRKLTAYNHASLLHGIVKATIAMSKAGSGWPCFAARRLVFEYFVKLAYYDKNPEQAVLYAASAPMIQKRFADEWAKVDPTLEFPDPALHKEIIAAMKARFTGLMVPKGKSGSTPTPVYREWSEADLKPAWLEYIKAEAKEHPQLVTRARANLGLGPDVPEDEVVEMFAEQKYLMNAEYPSQDIHGTALTLIPTLDGQPVDGFRPFADHFKNTNEIVWGAVGFAMDGARILARVGGVLEAAAPIVALQVEVDAMAQQLGIR